MAIVWIHLVSSAYNRVFTVANRDGMSLMKMRNNSGPSILPCGTPDVTGSRLEDLLLIDTH